jgi:hypothetical protein
MRTTYTFIPGADAREMVTASDGNTYRAHEIAVERDGMVWVFVVRQTKGRNSRDFKNGEGMWLLAPVGQDGGSLERFERFHGLRDLVLEILGTIERQASPKQFMCNTCEALVDFPGRHCTGTAIEDHDLARLQADRRRVQASPYIQMVGRSPRPTMTASTPEPAYQPAAEDVLHPTKEDFRSAAIYARAMGSREGRYVTLASGVTYTPEQEAQITACVIRVHGSWRVLGCCETLVTECYECNALFQDLNDGSEIVPPPAAETVTFLEPWASGYPSASATPEVKLAPGAIRAAWQMLAAQTHLPDEDVRKLGLALDVFSRQPMLAKVLAGILLADAPHVLHAPMCTDAHDPAKSSCSR